MEELCTACFCAGRKLFLINETAHEHLYSQIINEMPMYNPFEICIRVCWECKALLRKLGDFKEQVKRCYTELLAYVQQNAPKPFANYPRLQCLQVHSDSYPQCIKEEVDEYSPIDVDTPMNNDDEELDVKIEEHHCEPETFVKDLNVEKLKKKRNLKNVKKVEKPIKEKTKRKVKIKPQKKTPKAAVEVSRRISRTVESIIQSTVNDCYNKQEHVTEDDHIPEDVTEDDHIPEDVTEYDHISEDVAEDVTEDGNTPDDVEKEEKVKIKVELSNGVKIPKAVALKEVLSDKPVCSECGKTFSSRKTYRYHLNVLHKGQNRYPCPRCGKVYQWKSNLGRHMRSHKARDSGELYCETCDKRFASVATYRQHLRISRRHVSESEFSFMCNECGKKFVNKTRLRDHIDWEHLKKIKFKCQLCNKPFKCHTSLYVHLQNVHRSKDKKDNLCHVCGKSYQNAAKLKYHIVAMHTSETPYQCQQCSAAFGWYSSLYRHVREVHYKMKVQPKKSKKPKKSEVLPSLLPVLPQQIILPQIHQPGPA